MARVGAPEEYKKAYRHWYRHYSPTSTRAWWKEYKTTLKCEQCGESHPACLDFHHLSKETKVSTLNRLARNKGKEAVLAELAKCIVLCANCHRKLHWGIEQARVNALPTEEPVRQGWLTTDTAQMSASEALKEKWATDAAFREQHRARIIEWNRKQGRSHL